MAKKTAAIAEVDSVIFDMDGVIIDSHPAHRRAWQEFLRTLGKDVSDHELDFILDGRKRHEILRHFLGEVSEAKLREYGRRKDRIFEETSLEVRPVPGAVEFIKDVKRQGIKLAIATSASRSRTGSTLQRLGLADHFSVVVTGDDVREGKPDPAVYRLVCRRIKSDVRRSIAIEDAVSGVRAAREAGLKCVGVGSAPGEDKLRQAGAAHVIENFLGVSLADLQAILADSGKPTPLRIKPLTANATT